MSAKKVRESTLIWRRAQHNANINPIYKNRSEV